MADFGWWFPCSGNFLGENKRKKEGMVLLEQFPSWFSKRQKSPKKGKGKSIVDLFPSWKEITTRKKKESLIRKKKGKR